MIKKHRRNILKHYIRVDPIFIRIACVRIGLRIPLGLQQKERFSLREVQVLKCHYFEL
jgi:hypothetical protein